MNAIFLSSSATIVEPFRSVLRQLGWQTSLVDNAQAAALMCKQSKVDAVLVYFDGAPQCEQLLAALAKKQPKVVRVALVDNADVLHKQRASMVAHQTLIVETALPDFHDLMVSLTANKQVLNKQKITRAIKQVKTLPSPPKTYLRLNSLLQDPATDSQKIADVVAQDPALAAKVLQFANTPFIAGGSKITDIVEAITRAGVDTLCCIVMTAELFAYEPNIAGYSVEEEQLYSLSMAKFTSSLVSAELKASAMLAGLLHGIGKLVLYEIDSELTAKFYQAKPHADNMLALEAQIFGVTHAQIGGYLLHLWGFSPDIIEAVILYGRPEKLKRKRFDIAAATYTANQLLRQQPLASDFEAHYQLTSVLAKLQKRAQQCMP